MLQKYQASCINECMSEVPTKVLQTDTYEC